MKNGLKILLIVISLLLIWYFFIKPSDYTINFTSKTLPGPINQSIKLWGKGFKHNKEITGIDQLNIDQTLAFSDTIYNYRWTIKPVNDSLSKVKVDVTDSNWLNSLVNRLKVPFVETDFSKRSEKTVFEFMKKLKDHVDNYKVTIVGEEETPEKFFAHVNIVKEQFHKAQGMMENANFISEVLLKNNIQLDGFPIIEVEKWDRKNDSIIYNFGFPIKKLDTLPDLGEIKIKHLAPKKSLKAIFNGNYISSDRAWYTLLDHAQKNNIDLLDTPIEIFHNNPHMGGDSSKWVTEVYMPIDTTDSKRLN